MTNLSQRASNAFAPDEHGFFDDLVTMLVSLASYLFSMHVSIASNNPTPFSERPLSEWIGYILPVKSLEFPLFLEQNATKQALVVFPAEILMNLSLDSWPQWIEYRIASKGEARPSLLAEGNRQVISRIVGASFVNYYSNSETKIKTRFGADPNKWPELIRFAWIIRNGFAHGGKLKISDPLLRAATWKIWSLDHKNDGQKLLFETGMLGIGDIITLMQDIDSVL